MDFYFSNIQLVLIGHGESASERTKNCRKNNLLLYKTSGTTYYDFGETSFCLRTGDIIFVPDGASYSVKTTVAGGYIAAIFKTDANASSKPCKLKLAGGEELFSKLLRSANSADASERLRCCALFFDILHRLSVSDNLYVSSVSGEIVSSAIREMERKYRDTDFKLTELYRSYGISNVYFCELFKRSKGMTPSEYLAQLRLGKAKELLSGGATVSSVAESCGFSDPLYFSKFFRKHTGVPPSMYFEIFAE